MDFRGAHQEALCLMAQNYSIQLERALRQCVQLLPYFRNQRTGFNATFPFQSSKCRVG